MFGKQPVPLPYDFVLSLLVIWAFFPSLNNQCEITLSLSHFLCSFQKLSHLNELGFLSLLLHGSSIYPLGRSLCCRLESSAAKMRATWEDGGILHSWKYQGHITAGSVIYFLLIPACAAATVHLGESEENEHSVSHLKFCSDVVQPFLLTGLLMAVEGFIAPAIILLQHNDSAQLSGEDLVTEASTSCLGSVTS